MNLKLDKALVVLDLETTGINVTTDRIVEIALIKIQPNGQITQKHFIVNPLIPIPKVVSDIHGITDADVADKPSFKQIAGDVKSFIDGCDLAGYNSNKFDIPLLHEEFMRVGIPIDLKNRNMIDALQIFVKMEKRNLEAAYKFYCNKQLQNSHSALADAQATLDVLLGQMEKYPELNMGNQYLNDFSKGEDFLDYGRRLKIMDGKPVFNFGKYKNTAVEEVFKKEPAYYHWMMKGDFAQDTKQAITDIYLKIAKK
jgi:DNA polymerase III subunit epsilon